MSFSILIISISNPIKVGVYENENLIDMKESKLKTSEILLNIIMKFFDEYKNIETIYYTNGPGSYMSIKLTYIILRTFEILKNIKFYGYNSFGLNKNQPIKSVGNFYFIQDESGKISMQNFNEEIKQVFFMPTNLNSKFFLLENTPLYILPSV